MIAINEIRSSLKVMRFEMPKAPKGLTEMFYFDKKGN